MGEVSGEMDAEVDGDVWLSEFRHGCRSRGRGGAEVCG